MNMLARQREREILTRLRDAGAVRVVELAPMLQVTEETIRRDLAKLSGEGKLLRAHGGAVALGDERHDLPFEVRKTANLEAKKAIAAHALRHVAEGDVIALDASSTIYELARILPDIRLTVVTNSLPASAALMSRQHVRVLSTGGMLDATSRSWTGSLAEHALDQINITKLFLSSKGVDLSRGLSEVEDAQARVKRRMMDVAEHVFLLVDHSKLGVRSVVFLANLTDVDVLITDAATPTDVMDELAKLGVKTEMAGG